MELLGSLIIYYGTVIAVFTSEIVIMSITFHISKISCFFSIKILHLLL